MKKRDFEDALWLAIQYFWAGDLTRHETMMDHLAWYATDEQWQLVDDTIGYLENPDGYIISEVALETPTSPFSVITE